MFGGKIQHSQDYYINNNRFYQVKNQVGTYNKCNSVIKRFVAFTFVIVLTHKSVKNISDSWLFKCGSIRQVRVLTVVSL